MAEDESVLIGESVCGSLITEEMYENALDCYFSTFDSQTSESWNNVGVVFSRLGFYAKAEMFYRRALELNPRSGISWFNMGKVYFFMKRYKKAVSCFSKSVKLMENKSAWNNLGVSYSQLGKYQRAVASYDKALSIDPHYLWAWYNKAHLMLIVHRTDEAKDILEKMKNIDSDNELTQQLEEELNS